jgi:hypothetical protein
MASLYYRKKAIWINYKDSNGKWRNKNTGYHTDNPGERRQAERLADAQTLQERLRVPSRKVAVGWDWVDRWIETTWGKSKGTTPDRYRKHWRTIHKWLSEAGLNSPITLRREHCLEYPQWREQHNGGRNTAVHELKFFGQVLQEAVNREMTSPTRLVGSASNAKRRKRSSLGTTLISTVLMLGFHNVILTGGCESLFCSAGIKRPGCAVVPCLSILLISAAVCFITQPE